MRSQRELHKQLQGEINPTEQSCINDPEEPDKVENHGERLDDIEKDSLEDDTAGDARASADEEQPEAVADAEQSSPGVEDLRCQPIDSVETTITRCQPQASAVSDTVSVSSSRSNLSALRRLRMNRSNFGRQVQDVVSKIDNLFQNPNSEKLKSGSVVYHNRLSPMQGHENAADEEHDN